jgi:hypothetical protein
MKWPLAKRVKREKTIPTRQNKTLREKSLSDHKATSALICWSSCLTLLAPPSIRSIPSPVLCLLTQQRNKLNWISKNKSSCSRTSKRKTKFLKKFRRKLKRPRLLHRRRKRKTYLTFHHRHQVILVTSRLHQALEQLMCRLWSKVASWQSLWTIYLKCSSNLLLQPKTTMHQVGDSE